MSEAYDSFNAPQFVDFSKAPVEDLDESVDAYFDVDHENQLKKRKSSCLDTFYSPISPQDTDAEVTTTNHYNELDPLEKSYEEPKPSNLRRSMSIGNLVLFSEEERQPYSEDIGVQIEKININHNDEVKTETASKRQNDVPRNRSSAQNTSRRKGSQNHLDKLAQPKRYASVENLSKGNNGQFVSLAEAINKFQNRTPVRFRSKPNLARQNSSNSQTLFRTVPESPALHTKARSRPVNILSQEEREKMEIEKMQKFKIKAHPVNKKVLQGPMKPVIPIEKKAPTVQQPFNLTSVPPKKTMPSPKKYEFHAKPMPRSAEKPRRLREVERKQITKPVTPTFMKNYKMPVHKTEEKETNEITDKTKELKVTKPKPFSFENRDKMIQKKREQVISKMAEEERKAREFHAKPLPKTIYGRGDSVRSDSGSSHNSSKRHTSAENLCTQFKARPPIVLFKEPFIPVKTDRPLTELAPFQLTTEQRACEREEYEREKREREENLEHLRKIREEEMLRKEQEEIARLRKKTEYKAKPIKKYKEVIIQPSNKITEPLSPNFQTEILRKMKNKENIPGNSNTSC